MGRGDGQRPMLVKFVDFGKKLETLISMRKLKALAQRKWRKKYQQFSFFFAIALK
jgi:hypothetical protein